MLDNLIREEALDKFATGFVKGLNRVEKQTGLNLSDVMERMFNTIRKIVLATKPQQDAKRINPKKGGTANTPKAGG